MLTARLKKTPTRGARFGVITNLLLAGFSFYDRILLIYVIDFAGGEDPVGSGRGRKPQHPVLVESGHYANVRFGWKADISSSSDTASATDELEGADCVDQAQSVGRGELHGHGFL